MWEVYTSPHSALPQFEVSILALLATPFLRQALMQNSTGISARHLEKVISPNDPTLLAFVSSLRLSVRSTVIAERRRGIPLAEIVAHVREIVRAKEEATDPSTPGSSLAFRAITKCAVGWCIDAYLPSVAVLSRDRFPLRSPT